MKKHDVILQYEKDHERVTKTDDTLRKYLGSGTGRWHGDLFSGNIRWDLLEAQGPMQCDARIVGTVELDDGGAIDFEVIGFFRRQSNESTDWLLTGSFVAETERADLKGAVRYPAMCTGKFDSTTGRHAYSVIFPDSDAVD